MAKKKHKWKYQINIKKKILVLTILGIFLFVGLGYAILGTDLGIGGILEVGQPFITVTFDADGGTVSPTSKNYVQNKNYTDLPTPTKTGYNFLGWNGKNLLNYNDLTNISSGDSGITVDVNGNISDSTPTTDDRGPDYGDNQGWRLDLPQGIYTISLRFSQHSTSDNSELKIEDEEYKKYCSKRFEYDDVTTCTFELSEAHNINIVIKAYDGIYKVQLEAGADVTDWEPYYITNGTPIMQKENHTLKAKWKLHEANFQTDSYDLLIFAYNHGDPGEKLKEAMNNGTTREVELDLDNDPETAPTIAHLRIANLSTPQECSTQGFSQTACGFVLEFVDIITLHRMNPYTDGSTNGGGNKGGWEYSDMRAYLNSTTYAYENIDYSTSGIYNALPSELRSKIIDTTVVSGYGSNDTSHGNFTTTDKLYLLSSHEVWEDVDGNVNSGIDYYDKAYNNTRQLDYYANLGVTTSNYADAIKKRIYNGNYYWWLRSAYSSTYDGFFYVYGNGNWTGTISITTDGVSPAFRIA